MSQRDEGLFFTPPSIIGVSGINCPFSTIRPAVIIIMHINKKYAIEYCIEVSVTDAI